MKISAVALLTIFFGLTAVHAQEETVNVEFTAEEEATPTPMPKKPAAPRQDGAVELYSLDYNEDLDVFYAEGTEKPYTGLVYSTYDNGSNELEGALKDGKRDGHWVEKYENGKTASDGNYSEGKEVGAWKYWFENGTLQSEGSYSDASPVGPWKTYYENGKVESEGNYVAGEMDGEWKLHDDTTGEVRVVKFKDGEQLP